MGRNCLTLLIASKLSGTSVSALSVMLCERCSQIEETEEQSSRNSKMFRKWDITGIAELERNL